MEKSSRGSWSSTRLTRVDFPEPEGAETMKTVVITSGDPLFQIEGLLADLFHLSLHGQPNLSETPAGLARAH
jgi:hypothetical protein